MTANLNDTVALVTGASSGIGAATAVALAGRGATVAVAARRKDRLDELVARIGAGGGRAFAIEADITDQKQAEAMVERTVSELGRLDTLVNNAGVMLLGPAADAPLEEWQRMVDLNVSGVLYTTYAALPRLVEAAASSPRGVADLVNISSVAGRTVRPGSGVYNLTKHGLGAFSESLRQEYLAKDVRVSLVEPGAVATELRDHLRPEIKAAQDARFKDMEPLQAEDIAEVVEFVVTRRSKVAVNEVLVRPIHQA